MKEFLTRTLTAVFLIIAAFALIKFVPLLYFSIVLFALISGAALEFHRLSAPVVSSRLIWFLSGAVVAASFTFGVPELPAALVLVLLLNGLFFLFALTKKENLETFTRDIGIHFMVVFYLYFPLYFLFELKKLGPNYLFFLIFVIAVGDSAAYFFGRAFGKHKIYPVASPKKSLEGLIADIIFAALTAWASLALFPLETPVKLWQAMVTGGIIGLFSQLSDPLESLFKRAAGKKDSGSLLPGHGGILDRVDSYIFCAPVLFYLVKYFWS